MSHRQVVEPVEQRVGHHRGERRRERIGVDELWCLGVEVCLELLKRHAGLDHDVHRIVIDLDDPVHPSQVDHDATGAGYSEPGHVVAGHDRRDRLVRGSRRAHHCLQLVSRRRPYDY